jgi:shikimate kinase
VTESSEPHHVVLVGLMGTGKTTVGRLVGASLGWPVSDSDEWIEATEGRTAREIRDTLGTDAIHELESRHLLAALAAPGPTVVCAAASTVDDEACRDALQGDGILVAWLTARPETAAARFDDQAHRPRYGDDPLAFLAEQARRRDPWFREVADLVLETDDATPEELAAAIVARVRA